MALRQKEILTAYGRGKCALMYETIEESCISDEKNIARCRKEASRREIVGYIESHRSRPEKRLLEPICADEIIEI